MGPWGRGHSTGAQVARLAWPIRVSPVGPKVAMAVSAAHHTAGSAGSSPAWWAIKGTTAGLSGSTHTPSAFHSDERSVGLRVAYSPDDGRRDTTVSTHERCSLVSTTPAASSTSDGVVVLLVAMPKPEAKTAAMSNRPRHR
jgi:hypothetical protein